MSTITSDLQLVATGAAADAKTTYTSINGATGSANPTVDTDVKVQGTGCLQIQNNTTVFPTDYGLSLNTFTAINCTNKVLFTWRSTGICSNLPYKGQYGGMAVWVSSSNSAYNTSPYKVFDLDGQETNITGGWKSYAIDPTRTSGKAAGTLSNTAITNIAWTQSMLTSTAAGTYTDYVDVIRYGTGLKVKDNSGITGQGSNFSELYNTDKLNANAYGVIVSSAGIFYGMGKIYIGGNDAAYPTSADNQTALTYFYDTNQTLVWKYMPVAATFYELRVAANATQHTVFQLGAYDAVTNISSLGCNILGSTDQGAMSSQQETPGTLTAQTMFVTSGTRLGAGQSFTCDQIGSKMNTVQFWMAKVGSPTSTLTAKIYAHTGTLGTSSAPTGAALATSNPVSASTLSTSAGWITFTFTGANQIYLTDNTRYVITVEISGATSNSTNYVQVYTNSTSSVAPGNWSSYNGSTWTATASTDIVHRLNMSNPLSVWKLTATNTNNNLIKLYGSSFSNIYSADLNNNTRSIGVASCSTTNGSPTVTTTGNFTTSFIVPGMAVTGSGIPANTYVSSIESATSLTLSNNATALSTVTLTFDDKSEIRSCTFNNCGTITTNGCTIDSTTFENLATYAPVSATAGIVIASPLEAVAITNSNFVNCGRAIKITAAGDYYLNNLQFTGNTYDIENASTGTVNVYNINGSNAVTYINTSTGTTTINIPRTISISNLVQGTKVALIKQSDNSILAEAFGVGSGGLPPAPTPPISGMTISGPDANGRYTASYLYNYTSVTPIYVATALTNYQATYDSTSLINDDSTFQVSQQLDRQYYNPA